jgi:hypothetical protein
MKEKLVAEREITGDDDGKRSAVTGKNEIWGFNT